MSKVEMTILYAAIVLGWTGLALHNGVLDFDKTGNQIAHIEVPEKWSANVCFGGIDRQSFFITASKGLYEC